MALRNLFTPNLRPPLALLQPTHLVFRVYELGAHVNKLDGGSTSGSVIRAHDFRRTLERDTKVYVIRLGRPLSPPISFSIFACPFQSSLEDRFLIREAINKEA